MDIEEISSNEDLYEKVYIHEITKWFLFWKEKNIIIVVSKVLWEQRKFWILCKGQDDKLQIYRVQRWEISFPTKFKKVILTSSFDKNNLGEESFALGKEIHQNKRKRGYQDYRREHI